MSDNDTEKKVPLADATFRSLKAYAEGTLNIDVVNGWSAAQLRAKILQAAPDTTAIPDVADAAKQQQVAPDNSAPAPVTADAAQADAPTTRRVTVPMCRFIVHADDHGQDVCQIGVNGQNWNINKGEKVEAPYYVLNALEASTITIFKEHQESPLHPIEMVPVVKPSYPFSVLEPASKAAVEEWEALTNHLFAPTKFIDVPA